MQTQLIILFGSALLGYFFSKNKYLNIYLCFIVFALFAYSQDDFDYWAYQSIYEESKIGYDKGYEVAYVWLNQLCGIVGIKYESFRALIGLIFVIPLFLIIRRLTYYPNIVWGSIIFFPAMFDSTLLRNSLAMIIAIIGICYLLKTKNIQSYIPPFLLFCLASLFHSSYWVMLTFLPLWWYVDSRKKNIILIVLIALLFLFFSVNGDLLFSLYSKFSIREATIDKYQTGKYANLIGIAYNVVKYIFIISPILLLKIPSNSFYPRNHLSKSFMDNSLKLNLIFSIILIPQSFAINFSRLFRIIIIFNYVYIANHIKLKSLSIQYRLYACLFALILLVLLLLWESPTTLFDIFYMHLNTNFILNGM